MKESAVDKAVVSFAKERGLTVIKLTTLGPQGTSGWPDRMFLGEGPLVFFIEFKSPGKVSTPLQERRQAKLRQLGFHVYVCDNAHDGRMIVATEINGRSSAHAGALDVQEYVRVINATLPEQRRRKT